MKVVKVRRVGNSNVVSLPRELEASGYVPGTSVLVEELPDGELRILPTDRVRERVRVIAARAVSERAEALEIYAAIFGLTTAQAADHLRSREALEGALGRPLSYAHYQQADLALQAAVLAHGIAETSPSLTATSGTRSSR